MIFHFGINDYRDVRHCTPFVYRLSPESVHILENHGVTGHQEYFSLWYQWLPRCTPLYATVCYLSTDCFQKVYTFWKTMAYMIVCHCMLFVYRLFPESVHFLENHNSQSENHLVTMNNYYLRHVRFW